MDAEKTQFHHTHTQARHCAVGWDVEAGGPAGSRELAGEAGGHSVSGAPVPGFGHQWMQRPRAVTWEHPGRGKQVLSCSWVSDACDAP